MKNVLKITLMLFSISAFGQRVLPTNVNNDFINIIKKEGRYRALAGRNIVSNPRTTRAIDASIAAGLGSTPTVGKHAWLENIVLSSDKSCLVALVIKLGAWDNVGTTMYFNIGGNSKDASSTVTIPLNIIVRDGGGFAIYIQQNDAGEEPRAASMLNFYEFSADLNFEAQKTILLCGDSTTWCCMGNDENGNPYDGQELYIFKLRNKIIDSTKTTVRVVNKGFGGSFTPDWKKAIRSGEIDGINYDLLVISLGLNDGANISGSYTIQNFKDNLKLFALHRDRYRKGASILFLAPSPTDNAAMVININAIRTAVSEVVTELGGNSNKVYFANQNNAFTLNATATADVNITNPERVANGRVHPSGLGHTAIANYIWSVSKNWMYNNLK